MCLQKKQQLTEEKIKTKILKISYYILKMRKIKPTEKIKPSHALYSD